MEDTSSGPTDSLGNCDEIVFLFELVGARHLVLRDEDEVGRGIDSNSLQPFCVVKYDGRRIHKTKPSEELGSNPIWTPHASKSIFLLRTTAKELSRSIMNISVYVKKESSMPSMLRTVTSVFMGQVHIDSATLLAHCNEERFELSIEDELGEVASNLGKLALRCRVATPSDIDILNVLGKKNVPTSHAELVGDILRDATIRSKETTVNVFRDRPARPVATLVTEKDESEMAHNSFIHSVGNIFAAKSFTCPDTGQMMRRVKPYPDPDRPKETEFLRPYDLNVETRLPSSKWTEAGSGSIGKLFVEILSCDDLPNMDSGGEAIGNFTDSFCALVYEDTCAMTDVIDDELSPRWMPWTNRAFCFNIIHPASILYLAVFDFDVLGTHDPIGRVAVNVCNLQRDTIHTLTYNLYPTSNVTERKAAGSITVRVRLEWFNPRAALLATWKPRPNMHVNVSKERSFRVVRYTCYGEYGDKTEFDVTLTRSYVNEMFEYKSAVSYAFSDTLRSLVLWRGQVEICSLMLPVHSVILFFSLSRLVEKPQLIVPYSLLGIAWIMLANLTIRRQHPSPWQSRLSFLDYLNILRSGKSSIPVKCIQEYEGAEAAKAYEAAWKQRVEKDLKIAEKKAELLQKISSIGDVNIHTEVPNQAFIPVDLLNRLARYQGILGRMCKKFRFMKIILTWEESVVSFFVTATFLSAGLVALLLPWGFILTWVGRIVVWGFLGPHMKIVDLFFRATEKKDGKLNELIRDFDIQSTHARLRREEALKVKDIKEVAFGTYSVQVPSFNLSRHHDRPLPQSSSRIYRKAPQRHDSKRVSVTKFGMQTTLIPGQQLYGAMIPRPEYDEEIYQYQKGIAEKKMESFKEDMKQISKVDGLSDYERSQLKRLDTQAATPMSIGYEVVPFEVCEAESMDTESTDESKGDPPRSSTLRNVSVKLMSDKVGYVDPREAKDMILQSDGVKTYCIHESSWEEEDQGMEVIGIGRFESFPYNRDNSEELAHEKEVGNRHSCVLFSTESTQVVYYDAPEHGELKLKNE